MSREEAAAVHRDRVAFVSPYHGGSHALLTDILRTRVIGEARTDVFTMRPKKWGWRMRAAALRFSQTLPEGEGYCSAMFTSMLNLAELCALRPDWAAIPRKVLYMHENQLTYPKQQNASPNAQERDYYFGHAQIASCLVADVVSWNSSYNMDSFLLAIPGLLATLPVEADLRPKAEVIIHEIRAKSLVVYFPIAMPLVLPSSLLLLELPATTEEPNTRKTKPLHIAWPHRFEHDKDPEAFLNVLFRLMTEGNVEFRISVFGGETYEGVDVRSKLESVMIPSEYIAHCGRVPSREAYLQRLGEADVALSTAQHEFFGIAMVEAARLGLRCLCPKRLSYVELFQPGALYENDNQLYKTLLYWCRNPHIVRAWRHTQTSNNATDLLPNVWSSINVDDVGVRQRFRVLLNVERSPKGRNAIRRRVAWVAALAGVLGWAITTMRRA